MQTPLGPTQSVLVREVSLFRGVIYVHTVRLGWHAVSALQWMFVFQGYPQGGVPLYLFHDDKTCMYIYTV